MKIAFKSGLILVQFEFISRLIILQLLPVQFDSQEWTHQLAIFRPRIKLNVLSKSIWTRESWFNSILDFLGFFCLLYQMNTKNYAYQLKQIQIKSNQVRSSHLNSTLYSIRFNSICLPACWTNSNLTNSIQWLTQSICLLSLIFQSLVSFSIACLPYKWNRTHCSPLISIQHWIVKQVFQNLQNGVVLVIRFQKFASTLIVGGLRRSVNRQHW